jgi:hypothetical protein
VRPREPFASTSSMKSQDKINLAWCYYAHSDKFPACYACINKYSRDVYAHEGSEIVLHMAMVAEPRYRDSHFLWALQEVEHGDFDREPLPFNTAATFSLSMVSFLIEATCVGSGIGIVR